MKKLIVLILLIIGCSAEAKHKYLEKDYQNYWCSMYCGQVELKLLDNTRVDCLTDEYAVEVDFQKKWAESIGQSLYYAIKTGKKPAVLLILENEDKNYIYLQRLLTVAEKYFVTVFTISQAELEKRNNHK